jgi:hypothetical protein
VFLIDKKVVFLIDQEDEVAGEDEVAWTEVQCSGPGRAALLQRTAIIAVHRSSMLKLNGGRSNSCGGWLLI